jgi:hypothetical protein
MDDPVHKNGRIIKRQKAVPSQVFGGAARFLLTFEGGDVMSLQSLRNVHIYWHNIKV